MLAYASSINFLFQVSDTHLLCIVCTASMENKVYIHIRNPQEVYYPGQTIKGWVECVFEQPQIVEGIFLKVKGRAKTSIHGNKTMHHDKEYYFNQEFNLLSNNGRQIELSANTYSYPFSYILPNRLPSTYEFTTGSVRYWLKAKVQRPWKLDFHHKLLFRVISPANYNLQPLASFVPSEPPSVTDCRTLGCSSCTSGTIEASVVCSSRVLMCNTPVTFSVNILNTSSRNCELVKLKIYALFVYHAKQAKLSRKSTLIKWEDEGVPSQSERSWSTSKLLQGDFVNLTDCGIIKCNYFFEVNCVLPLLYRNFKIQLPLIIGDVPFENRSTQIVR